MNLHNCALVILAIISFISLVLSIGSWQIAWQDSNKIDKIGRVSMVIFIMSTLVTIIVTLSK